MLPQDRGKTRFLVLDNNGEHRKTREYLAGLADCEEIDASRAIRDFRPEFKAKYVELISQLNRANHSFFWWAFYFTRKESLYTDFSRNIFYCGLIRDMISRNPDCDLVIVTNNLLMTKQVTAWANSQGLNTVNALKWRWKLTERVKTLALPRMAYTFINAVVLWLSIKRQFRSPVENKGRYIVIGTLLEAASFSGDAGYSDTYFGELPRHMSKQGVPVLVFGGILKNFRKTLTALGNHPTRFPVVPWPYYSSIADLLKAAWYTVLHYLRPIRLKGNAEMDGIQLNHLVRDAVHRDFVTGHFFDSVWLYYSAKALAKRVKVDACLFPFENRSWETMLMAGLGSRENSIRTVGFNHAAITPGHTNLSLGVHEADVIPLPDTIVTLGEATKVFLEKTGNYREGIFRIGCALRQGRSNDSIGLRRPRNKISRVLVALATSLEEYVHTLVFLEKSFDGVDSYEIGIRPHPVFPFSQAEERLGALKIKFALMGGSVDENLEWPDVVIYVSSTVGLTAISKGIPAINIDLGDFIDYDPAPEDCPLKWTVSEPQQLVPAIQRIDALSNEEFEYLQHRAEEFGKQYFRPVTDETLNEFTNLVVNGVKS